MNTIFLVAVLGVVLVVSILISNLNAILVNGTDFSIEVPNGWVYREYFIFDNGIMLTPNEFTDILINTTALRDVPRGGILAELAPDRQLTIYSTFNIYLQMTKEC